MLGCREIKIRSKLLRLQVLIQVLGLAGNIEGARRQTFMVGRGHLLFAHFQAFQVLD
jgi:hypothetical protein